MFSRQMLQRALLLMATSSSLALIASDALAQETATDPDRPAEQVSEIVVTGSRIQRSSDTTSPAPVTVVGAETLTARGIVQAGDVLSEITSMRPIQSGVSGVGTNAEVDGQAAVGAAYPNLFNLGAGRTLTLINGRRVIPTTGGLGDEAFDANLVPLGLLNRIDVVQGAGAAVYGSGAIGGVVNYVLKDNFNGLQADVQYGRSFHNDYPVASVRLTGGKNFLDGRANIAANLEFSRTGSLINRDREASRQGCQARPTGLPGAGSNGIPLTTYYCAPIFHASSPQGVPLYTVGDVRVGNIVRVNGGAVVFNDTGDQLVPYDYGTPVPGATNNTLRFSTGGTFPRFFQWDTPLVPGVERKVANIIGRFDLTDDIKLSTELMFGRSEGLWPQSRAQISLHTPSYTVFPELFPFPFTRNNPYLSAATVAALSASSPEFAAGQPLYLGKFILDIYPDGGDVRQTTDTYRAAFAADGKFDLGERKFNWSASYSYAESHLKIKGWYPARERIYKAANVVRGANGQPACAVNADADPNNNDAACVPWDMFGIEPASPAVRNYVLVQSGAFASQTLVPAVNKLHDALLVFGGDLFDLPGGKVQFSSSYEHREAQAAYNPLEADRRGDAWGVPVYPTSGSFNTDEFAGELVVPLLGRDFSLPGAQNIELNGSIRYVDHSIAGKELVWGAGVTWDVVTGMRLRGSIGRNFRAPNLGQLISPTSQTTSGVNNPCSVTFINTGVAPATRRANCIALFTANPTFGASATAPAGSPAEQRLAGFLASTITEVRVTSSGNPDLQNELSTTTSFGIVLQPTFVPGLSITADRIDLKLKDALTQYNGSLFAATCFDAAPQPQEYCSTFTYKPDGNITTALSTTVNAAEYRLKAESYALDYQFPLSQFFGGRELGRINLGLQATHNKLQTFTVAGTTNRTDDTANLPTWIGRANVRYSYERLRLNFTMNYLPSVKINPTATPANSPDLKDRLDSNTRYSVSAEYDLRENISIRAGVENITNVAPSFPTSNYGDVIGRAFFVGLRGTW